MNGRSAAARLFAALFARGLQRDTLLLIALNSYHKITGLVLLMIVTRALEPGDIGLYFFAITFAESFRLLASFGLDPVLTRGVVAAPGAPGGPLASVLGFRLLSSPVYLAVVTAAALAFTGASWKVVAVVALFTLFEDIFASLGAFFIATRRVGLSVGISAAIQTLFLGAVVIGFEASPSLAMLLAVCLLRTVALVATALVATHRLVAPLRARWEPGFVKSGVPFLLTTFLGQMRERLITLLLGFLATYAVVGHYQLAFHVIVAAYFVPVSVASAFFPRLAEHGFTPGNRRIFLRSLWGLAGTALLGVVAIYALAQPLASLLFGPLSGEVVPLLRALAPLLLLQFLEVPMASALQAMHHEGRVLRILGISTGAVLVAGLALIPAFGAHGAVLAQLLSGAIRVALLGWRVRELLRPAPVPGSANAGAR